MKELSYIVYKMIIYRIKLNLDNFKGYGLNDEDINLLLFNRVIRINNCGNYEITRPSKLRQYGVELLQKAFKEKTNKCLDKANEYREEAYKCFEKCYEMAPRCKDICIQTMEMAVRRKDYDLAFEAFENLLEDTKNKGNDNENNLILYLLSFVTTVPDKYIEKVKKLKFKDYSGQKREYEIRKAISNGRFTLAYKLQNDLFSSLDGYSVKADLIRSLLYKTIERCCQIERDVLEITKNKHYVGLYGFMKKIFNERALIPFERRVLKIVSSILIKNNLEYLVDENIINSIDDVLKTSKNPIDIALASNDFNKAYELNQTFLNKNSIDANNDTINVLLTELAGLSIIKSESTYRDTTNVWYDDIKNYVDLILSENITLEIAIKRYGIIDKETILLIKLEYARRCFLSNDEELERQASDLLIEVEMNELKTDNINYLIKQIHRQEEGKGRVLGRCDSHE